MFSVVVHHHVRRKIEQYIIAYRSIFLEIYDDTWLGIAEKIIKQQYLEKSRLFKDSIFESIKESLQQEIVWYTPVGDLKETSIRIGSHRIFLTYHEDVESMMRYIVDIEILRK
jgi:hypothetical protein